MSARVLADFPSHLSTYGTGPRKGLILHCSLAHSGVYGAMGQSLANTFSLIGFDQPGHGRAADWTGEGDLQDRVTEMALDLLTEPLDIIGHSFGGTVALRLAIERPEMVRSLVLIEPVMMAIAKKDTPEVFAALRHQLSDFQSALEQGDRETAARLFTKTYGDGRPWNSLSAESRAAISERIHMIGAGHRGVNEDFYDLIGSGALEAISIPTSIIDGGQGGPAMESVCAGLERRLQNAQRACIKGGGHMAPLTRPEAVAQEILNFVSQQPAK
ncbi:alpha/beta hydrolase [Planktotalea sp.]|uniref:alpha/beta fold hydrolase n=1 Tax=Planktotalea sp. TaxID=2029877 RepID=UPI00329947AD